MKWKSHQLITGMAVWAITDNPILAGIAMQGAVLPDALEFCIPKSLVPHRTWTHWWPIYALPLMVCSAYLYTWQVPYRISWLDMIDGWLQYGMPMLAGYAVLGSWWLVFGAICHILEDVCTGYIPLWTPYDRKQRRYPILFYPGSPKEYVFTTVICLSIGLFKYGAGLT